MIPNRAIFDNAENDNEIIEIDILSEAQNNTYLIHLDGTKMYYDLKHIYWWPGMKHEISEFIMICLVCQ
ncbi:zinc finger and BTB domain-containing protein 11-like [Gossypium australe]|uniref:Zinc finger and BTB domain-containing protein 11-like n=1 Tax=Gossypium australe TaxID=47621 RepID=A0A5B6VM99_9ROSI|nr:zinc finger and BTB domain-containing protein 11-like [Gossypium australe]